jgi:prepilin-type N-terminal cleavage/methylation domain-containing protein
MRNTLTKNRNRGFTLIELMITVVITSFMILASVTFLVTARKSNNVQSSLSELNSSGRFGIDQLTRDLRMAGYRDKDWMLGALENALVVVERASADGGDSISLNFEARRDCTFALPAAPDATTGIGEVTNAYQVVDGALQCNGQMVTDGIEEIQVYFGEDTDADGAANRWVTPTDTGGITEQVVAVRIHLLARTEGDIVATSATSFRYDNGMRDAINDGQIRREFTVTVALRNPT